MKTAFNDQILTNEELNQIDQSVDLIFEEMKKSNTDMIKIMNVLKIANDKLEYGGLNDSNSDECQMEDSFYE